MNAVRSLDPRVTMQMLVADVYLEGQHFGNAEARAKDCFAKARTYLRAYRDVGGPYCQAADPDALRAQMLKLAIEWRGYARKWNASKRGSRKRFAELLVLMSLA